MTGRPTYFNRISSQGHRRSQPKQPEQCGPMHIAASIVQILFILLLSITGAMKVWKHPPMRDQSKNLSYSLTYACFCIFELIATPLLTVGFWQPIYATLGVSLVTAAVIGIGYLYFL
jgi:hypothetical protein